MDHFHYHNGEYHCEQVPLSKIASEVGTPCYVYSRATLERHWHAFNDAFDDRPHLICYAVKANSNLAVLNCLAKLGSGFDVVSQGELERVLAAGGQAKRCVFSGVGKRVDELLFALQQGIYCINVESEAELVLLNQLALDHQLKAPVSLRINPDVDAKTHPYIATGLKENKFGIRLDDAIALYRRHADFPGIHFMGVDCHIGSQLTELAPFLESLDRLLDVVAELKAAGLNIAHLDLGGGLGVRYDQENPPHPKDYSQAVRARLGDNPIKIILEPGRAIAANAGVLLSKVLLLKDNGHKHFAVVDAAMNDLLRPALYQAWQKVVTIEAQPDGTQDSFDIVGPVCETGDFLAKERHLTLKPGALIAVRGAGAYGFTMSSNYNTRPRAAEVMVDGDRYHIVRPAEHIQDLFATESLL